MQTRCGQLKNMEVGKLGRSPTNVKKEVASMSSSPLDRAKLLATTAKMNGKHCDNVVHNQQQQQLHPKDRTMKMFNKVQVVYYLTRNGLLEHPHYVEVSHLATQPLRLKDVIDRLTVLRGKAMPLQYSWSCKRSYKNGYVWNDLSENDVIYASEGSEYVLKGSELLHERDFSETRLLGDLHMRNKQQRKDQPTRISGLMSKSNGTHHGHKIKEEATKIHEENLDNGDDNEEDDEEDEEKGSCNSSNAPCTTMHMEQEESYSIPSTSSTNSDKQPPQTPPASQRLAPLEVPKTSTSESKTLEKVAARVIEEDGDPAISTSLTRNNTMLLHLIACGGGGIFAPQGENKPKCNGGSRRNFNFSMKNSFMPCLKQQLSNRAMSTNNNTAVPHRIKGVADHQPRLSYRAGDNGNQGQFVGINEDEDEDMIMVRYMSENPRFGNLQSEEKEYFSGTILETMTQAHHQHTQSSGSASSYPHFQFPVLTKSSSYNELRCSKGGLQAAVASNIDEDDEKDDKKFTGIIKLCIPRKKSFSSCATKHC